MAGLAGSLGKDAADRAGANDCDSVGHRKSIHEKFFSSVRIARYGLRTIALASTQVRSPLWAAFLLLRGSWRAVGAPPAGKIVN
jgi:hypothetical protein